jgi:hypothetical protein
MSYRGAAIAGVTVFAARHLPLARATSLESWSDLSGVSHRRAGFFFPQEACARPVTTALIQGEPIGLRKVVAMVLILGGATLALQSARE